MRIVVDTNVLISALISKGRSYSLIDALLASRHTLIISRPIIEEFLRVSSDRKIRRYVTSDDVASFLRTVVTKAIIVKIISTFHVLKSSDDLILQTAYEGKADVIATGDGHLLGLRIFKGVRILSISEVISMLFS